MTDDIAIAHKDYDVRGGGEILVEHLAEALDAPLYVGRRDPACEPDDRDLDIRQIADSRVSEWCIRQGGLPRSLAYMNRWKLYDYDTVILSGNEPLWWHQRPDQTVIAYTHSTPRWLYDLFPAGVQGDTGRFGGLGRWLQEAQRQLYEHQITRPDLFVANSDAVARRIRCYWNIPSEQIRVVYPPVETTAVEPGDAPTRDYYFGLSRLCEPKRWGEVIQAFQGRDEEFKLAGRGPDADRLEALAAGHDNIELLGYIPDAEKWRRLAEATAFVFNARNEDFGIAPVEAMAAGTPVLGVSEGFTSHQVLDGQNGVAYERGALPGAIARFGRDGVSWDADRIAAFADRFSVAEFRARMQSVIAEAREEATVSVPWDGAADDDLSDRLSKPPTRADGGER
jgi:glycosyltransferase involved in cell wall biosynthesis